MNKFFTFIIVLFGLLLMPNSIFACEINSAKFSSRKEIPSKTCNDDCCKKDGHSKSKNNEGCHGKCNHSKCACASSCNTCISITEWNSSSNCFNFSSSKQNFCDYETTISSGFNSLWLIPKIS